MNKKKSVALCTYNGEKFIEQQLESIFEQSLVVDEIIICDDRSTDTTIAIIDTISRKYPNIIELHINDYTLGSIKNFEKAISFTSGEYIFLCDQDDVWHRDKVKKIIRYFEDCPNAEGVFTNAALINDNGVGFCGYTLWDLAMFSYNVIDKYKDFWKIYQVRMNMVAGATFCFTKKVKGFIFPFPACTNFYHDEWIALHLAERKTLCCLEDELTYYRIHTNQQVGDRMLERYEKDRKYADCIAGLKEPESYRQYLINYKMAYTVYSKFTGLKKNVAKTNLDIDTLIKGSMDNFVDIGKKMKQCYPLFFTIKKIIDKIRNKRQINTNHA